MPVADVIQHVKMTTILPAAYSTIVQERVEAMEKRKRKNRNWNKISISGNCFCCLVLKSIGKESTQKGKI